MNHPAMQGLRLTAPAHVKHARLVAWVAEIAALTEARKKGMIVVRSSRTGTGITARNGEANDDELDFVAADNLSPQKARILLMLGLTKTHDTKALQRMFMMY